MKDRAKKIRNDVILIISLLLAAASIFAALQLFNGGRADTVVVSIDGKELARFSLYEDIEYRIGGETDYNLLIIKNGKAYVSDADCRDGLCIRQGKISEVGQSIICLPHKTVIFLEDGPDK